MTLDLPAVFPRAAVVAALDALGLNDEDLSEVRISGTEVEVGVFLRWPTGELVQLDGELGQAFFTIPVAEPTD